MRILVAGLGGIGQRHVRNLRTLLGPDAEILAYRVRRDTPTLTDSLSVEPGQDLEAKYDIRVFTDLESAIAARPDAVLVCNPSALHVPVAIEAARAGCALFIEKPISNSLDGMAELLQEVDARGLVGLVGYQLRFHPGLVRAHELVSGGAIGRVVAARLAIGEYLPGWHAYEDYRRMYASRADQGGGVVLSQIHEFDYASWLFGLPTRVFAIGGHLSRLEIDVEDTASVLLECTVDERTIPVHIQLDYLQRPPTRTCEVIGDAGKVVVDLRQTSLTWYDEAGVIAESSMEPTFERNRLFLDEMQHFLACLAGDETPRVTIAEGFDSLTVALAAKKSMTTGRVIDVSRTVVP